MKKIFLSLLLIGIFMATNSESKAFELTSSTIKNDTMMSIEQMYKNSKLGCFGKNISPDLKWSNPPEGTKSYALVVYDPDAPTTFGWYHWIVIDIPTTVTSIGKGERFKPPAHPAMTDFKTLGYGGPCPPLGHGVHHYNFTIYALDVENLNTILDIPPVETEKKIKEHAIDSATITGLYERK